MKTLIIAAAIVSTFAFAATHAKAHANAPHGMPTAAPVATTPVYGPVTLTADVMVLDVTTVTHHGANTTHRSVSAAHTESYAEHVQRLMTAAPEMVSCAGCTPRHAGESYSGHISHLGDR